MEISKQYLELEPIGLVFVIFFAVILVVQFVAMIWHRMSTFSQIMATTDIFTRFVRPIIFIFALDPFLECIAFVLSSHSCFRPAKQRPTRKTLRDS